MKFSQTFIRAVEDTWQAIAPDALQGCEDMDNLCAVEMCIDADRLTMFSEDGEAAYAEFRAHMADVEYEQALKDAAASLAYPLV